MRQIGVITDPAEAKRFADYLLTLGITTRVDPSPQGSIVWVHREDRVPEASAEFAEFQGHPDDPKYQAVAGTAKKIRKEAEQRQREHEKKTVDIRSRWASERSFRRIPVTQSLIAISIAVFFLTGWGRGSLVEPLLFATPHAVVSLEGPRDPWTMVYDEGRVQIESNVVDDLRRGEIWRPLTPIFLHFGPFHILFNMSALIDLGAMFELRRGSLRLLLFVILAGLVSNSVQYFYMGNPFFGGMSGVIFAIFGYIWMKGLYSPELGMGFGRQTVMFMLLYLFVTMTMRFGAFRPANGAHLGGLIFGVLVGLGPHLIPTGRGRDDGE